MPMFRKLFATLAAACLAVALGGGDAQAQSVKLDNDFSMQGIKWSGSGQTVFIFKVSQNGDKAIVCGVYASDGPVPEVAVRKLLQSASVRIGNTAIVSNLTFFKNASGNVSGARAPCRTSRKGWKDSYAKAEPKLRFPNKRIEF